MDIDDMVPVYFVDFENVKNPPNPSALMGYLYVVAMQIAVTVSISLLTQTIESMTTTRQYALIHVY